MVVTFGTHEVAEAGKKILIVDDDDVYRRSLIKVLAKHGYFVSAAATREEALEFLAVANFALVIVDVRRPYQGGLELLHSLLAASGEAKILVVTTFDEKDLAQTVLDMGAVDCLIKPVKRDAILAAVSLALRERNS